MKNQSDIPLKECTHCKKKLAATKDNFHAQKNGKFGFRAVCKPCNKIYRKKYTSTNEYKKAHRERQAKWRKENPEKSLEISRKNYRLHGDKHNEKRREKYKNDPNFRKKCIEREKKYKESGRRYEVQSRPDQREKARLRSKKRRLNPTKREHDLNKNAKWRRENKELIKSLTKKKIKELHPCYVAHTLRISVNDLDDEIYNTKKNIIKIKRELKKNNIKIR